MSVNSFSGQPAIPASYGFTAGKNKIINGDFGVWQRGTSFTHTSSVEFYTADRFAYNSNGSGGTITISQQTFSPGTAPVSGYEGQFFLRYNCVSARTSLTFNVLLQKIEDVRTFAGQTVTLSYWAKASTNTTLAQPYLDQNFGSGGSSNATVVFSAPSLTTSWQRFTSTVNVPSVSGKTIGANSLLTLVFQGLPNTSGVTVDFWGVQLEAGATATSFQTATGTIQGELAACQRYYEVLTAADINGICYTTANAYVTAPFKVTKRTDAITITYAASNTNLLYAVGSGYKSPTAVATETYDANALGFTATGFSTTSMAIGYPLRYTGSNIGISAEL